MRTRLFSAEAVPEFTPSEEGPIQDLEARLTAAIQASSVAFTLLWTRGLAVLISGLLVRKVGETEWRQVLTQQWIEDDGEFSQPLGLFNSGDQVEVAVIAMALDADVPRVVAAVSIQPGSTVKQIIPPTPNTFETMTRGTSWIKKGTFTL